MCKWLRVLSFSGVEVPWELVTAIIDRHDVEGASLESQVDIVIAVNANMTRVEPTDFAKLCCRIFVTFADGTALEGSASDNEVA